MGRIVIAEPSLGDAAVLRAAAGADALPVGNLQTQQPGEAWRSTAVAGDAVEADLGAAAEVDLIALLYTNAASAATWRVRAAAVQPDLVAAPGYDSGSLPVWPAAGLETWPFVHAILWLGAAVQSFRWWRVDYADLGNPDGYLQAGRLYIAKAWQPSRNRRRGLSLGFQDLSPRERTRGGQLYPLALPRTRVLSFALGFLSEAEMYANAFELDRLRGRSGDLLVIPDPDKPAQIQRQAVYGLQAELTPIVDPAHEVFETAFTVEEQI
ncbi:MAG: hypothetical protein MI785_17410 [Kiloniellales bacterium]|nr:hypothetical protein [Kiloniellales bacterium]